MTPGSCQASPPLGLHNAFDDFQKRLQNALPTTKFLFSLCRRKEKNLYSLIPVFHPSRLIIVLPVESHYVV